MLAGLYAAGNLLGETHDVWSVDPDALDAPAAGAAPEAAPSRAGADTLLVSGAAAPPEDGRQLETPVGGR